MLHFSRRAMRRMLVLGCLAALPLPAVAAEATTAGQELAPGATAAPPTAAAPAAATPNSAADILLNQAELLLVQRKSAAAYDLLVSNETQYAGSPRYDYLFGLAALDTAHFRDAITALERLVANQPGFAGGRMELARAYFESGDYDTARKQFEYLQKDNPPASTLTIIQQYLTAIEQRTSIPKGSRYGLGAEAGVGYDTNANGATAESSFLGFILNPRNVSKESPFVEVAALAAHNYGFNRTTALVSTLRLSHRANTDASFIDQTIGQASSTLGFKMGDWRGSVGVSAYKGYLDGKSHERGINVEFGASRRFASHWDLGSLLRVGRVKYDDQSLTLLDVDRVIGGVALTRINLGDHSGRIGVAVLGGRDRARQAASPYGNTRFGGRIFGSVLLKPQSSLYLEASWQRANFSGGAGFFGTKRRDNQYVAIAAVEFQNWPRAKWTVSPQIRFSRIESNVALFAYDRVEAMLWVKRIFK